MTGFIRASAWVWAAMVAVAMAADTEPVVDRIVQAAISANGPGVAVMVSRPGEAPIVKGYGLANLSTGMPIDSESLFDLASVSKPITALAILSLVQARRLSLDTPVRDVIPEFQVPVRGRAVTIRDLLQHTSGLRDYTEDFPGSDAEFAELTTETHVEWLNRTRPTRAPGRVFEYNNSNYCLLARVAEVVEGQPFAQVVRRRVLRRAGMRRSFIYDGTLLNLPAQAVEGYIVRRGKARPSQLLTAITGDGNVYSSVNDLLALTDALANGRIISDRLLRQAWSPGRLDDGSPIRDGRASYGLGWERFENRRYVGHSGGWYGTSTFLLLDRRTNLTIAVLSNDENLDVDRIAFRIAGAVQ